MYNHDIIYHVFSGYIYIYRIWYMIAIYMTYDDIWENISQL